MESREQRRTVTIRWSLIRNLSLLLVFLTASILLALAFFGSEIRDRVARSLVARALDATESELFRYFDPVRRGLRTVRRQMANGALDPDDAQGLSRTFVPLLASTPQISGINIGDERGRGYSVLRVDGGFRTRVVDAEAWGERLELAEWGEEGVRLRAWTVEDPAPEEVYDPRTRDWYRVAVDAAAAGGDEPGERIFWTEPYVFFTGGEPGLTAMIHVRAADGRRLVLAFDVLLRDLSSYTRSLRVSENGFVAVLAETGQMLGLPYLGRFDEAEARSRLLLQRPIDVEIPALHDAARAFAALPTPRPPMFSFESGRERFWSGGRPFELGVNRRAITVVILPERDLVGPLDRLRLVLLGVSGAGFAAALAMAFLLARRYAAPLGRLARNSERIGALELSELEPVASSLREVDQLASEQERMRVTLDSFARYVPVEVVRRLMERGQAARIGGERCQVTALFTDITGFTSVSEAMEPEVLTAHLAAYFEVLLRVVQEDGFGTVTQLTGDGIIGFWGAPVPDEAHAAHAAAAVLRAQEALGELNARWAAEDRPRLGTRFGLASGEAVVGNFGAESRLLYTAIGDTVNLASRLEGLSRFYGTTVLASGATRARAEEGFHWRHVDAVRVKGKARPVEIHELLGARGCVPPERLEAARRFEEALERFRGRDFAEAAERLEALAGSDPVAARLLVLARELAATPPPEGWDGVTDFFEK